MAAVDLGRSSAETMLKTSDPCRFVLVAVAEWMNQEQQHAIQYCGRRTGFFVPNWATASFASRMTTVGDSQPKPGRSEENCWRKWRLLLPRRHCLGGAGNASRISTTVVFSADLFAP